MSARKLDGDRADIVGVALAFVIHYSLGHWMFLVGCRTFPHFSIRHSSFSILHSQFLTSGSITSIADFASLSVKCRICCRHWRWSESQVGWGEPGSNYNRARFTFTNSRKEPVFTYCLRDSVVFLLIAE